VEQIKKQIFFFFFLSLIFVGGVPHVADAAPMIACQKLTGDTTVVTSIVKDAQGIQYPVDNSGQNFIEGKVPSANNKQVYVAPDLMAACAEKVDTTVYLKGWLWNDNIGWISLYCPGDGTNRGVPCGFVKYGVSIDGFGNLSGYAWSSVGWIRMTCKASPGYGDTDICAQSAFKVKVNLTDPVANYRTWAPYTYAWSDTIGWIAFDNIRVPWNTLKDVVTENPLTFVGDPSSAPYPECAQVGKTYPDICLREKDFVPVEIPEPVLPDPAAIVLKPGVVNPGDDFPVTWNKVRYIGNANTDATGKKALNPVTQADVRNLIFRNVAKWKKVASTSCGDNGAYLMKFTASDEVFYCKGNVILDASANNWKGNKTIIVEDGNVYIKNNLYSTSGQFGIIALKSNIASKADTGNIYVGPNVREMRVQMYADGYVLPANANNQVATGADYAIAGADTLFGQLYIRGMIVAGNTGSYVAGTDVAPSDLSALRSVPANPLDNTKALKWSDYFNAKQGLPVYVKDTSGNLVNLSESTANAKFKVKEKLSSGDVGTLKTNKLPDPAKFKTVGGDPAGYQEGVILQYEPPASTLGGFEGILGNAYKQTK